MSSKSKSVMFNFLKRLIGKKNVTRCTLENPDLPIEFVRELLISKNQDKSLAQPFNEQE